MNEQKRKRKCASLTLRWKSRYNRGWHHYCPKEMETSTVFDRLADLALIEILSYLSCTNALCAFTCLDDRWTRLLAERGFFRQVNLSAAYSGQFHQLLHILPLASIETLVIDRSGSPLQLRRWTYLPRLTRLHLRGVWEYDSVLFFVLLHAATLTHITIESDEYSLTVSHRNRLLNGECISLSSSSR